MQVRSSPRGAVRDGGKQDGWEWSERMGRGQRRRPMGRNPNHSRKPAYCVWVTDGHLVRCMRQRADGNDTDDGPRLSGEAQNPEAWSGSPAGRRTGGVSYCVFQKEAQRLDRHVAVGFFEIAHEEHLPPKQKAWARCPLSNRKKAKTGPAMSVSGQSLHADGEWRSSCGRKPKEIVGGLLIEGSTLELPARQVGNEADE